MRFLILALTTFVMGSSALSSAQACDHRSARLKGEIVQIVQIKHSNTCLGFLRLRWFTPAKQCGFSQEIIEFSGLPISCDSKIGQTISGTAFYYPAEQALYFKGLWTDVIQPDHGYNPNWPF